MTDPKNQNFNTLISNILLRFFRIRRQFSVEISAIFIKIVLLAKQENITIFGGIFHFLDLKNTFFKKFSIRLVVCFFVSSMGSLTTHEFIRNIRPLLKEGYNDLGNKLYLETLQEETKINIPHIKQPIYQPSNHVYQEVFNQ